MLLLHVGDERPASREALAANRAVIPGVALDVLLVAPLDRKSEAARLASQQRVCLRDTLRSDP